MNKELINVTYIISDIDKALAFEWIAQYLNKDQFRLSFILLNPGSSQLEIFLQGQGLEVHRVVCRGKKDWPKATWQTWKLLKQIRPDVVHCHLLQANVIGLAAARLAGIKKRIYTRHHSSLHHVYHPKGIWWDKIANKLSTHIVAISGIVQKILVEWEKVPATKVLLIPHGFKLDEFRSVSPHRVEQIRKKYQLDNGPVIGVISRFTEIKGVQYIIPAFQELLAAYPTAILLLLNAKGDYEKQIKTLLKEIPSDRYRMITFEQDISAAYNVMDVFVHVPIDEHSEAFGQIYVEALVAGIPSVFTRSGIANESFFNNDVAVMVEHKSSDQIFNGIMHILSDKEGTRKRIDAGKKTTRKFDLPVFIKKLENLYSE